MENLEQLQEIARSAPLDARNLQLIPKEFATVHQTNQSEVNKKEMIQKILPKFKDSRIHCGSIADCVQYESDELDWCLLLFKQ